MKKFLFLLIVLCGLFMADPSFAAIIKVSPVNRAQIYEQSVVLKAAYVPYGETVYLRLSNSTGSVYFDTDVTKYVDITGHFSWTVQFADMFQKFPGETEIYWHVFAQNTGSGVLKDRWSFIMSDILKPFPLYSPSDYAKGSEQMTFTWGSAGSDIQWYIIYFTTTAGFSYEKKVTAQNISINTKQLNFPKNVIISWRVKAFKDNGINNCWSKDWWNFSISASSVEDEAAEHGIFLDQNNPNPLQETATINFELSQETFVTVSVMDLQGNTVDVLINQMLFAGKQSINFDRKSLPSGTYFYQLQVDGYRLIKKMIIL